MSTKDLIEELKKELKLEDLDHIIAICQVLVTRPWR